MRKLSLKCVIWIYFAHFDDSFSLNVKHCRKQKKFVVGKPKAGNSTNNKKIEVVESLTNNSPFTSLIIVEALKCQSKSFTNN